jgi:hypothetical protein
MKYKFEIGGTAQGAQTWSTSGVVQTPTAGAFHLVPHMVMEASFRQLTGGKAVFGNPGIGCDGPYAVTRMLIEKEG